MKRRTVLYPLSLPRLSDRSAAQLLDILDQLQGCMRHLYAEQAWRWQRRQQPSPCRRPMKLPLDDNEPF